MRRPDEPPDASRRRRRLTEAGSDPGFSALKARLIARTGHHYYADKDDLLFDRLAKRFRALELPDATAYLAHLEGAGGREEWAALEAEITIGETFFFRYAEQFAALRERILPALIAARAGERRLRIWSAGCSTGAEPYSVAILIHELIGSELPKWDVAIVGTDISAAALATARGAEYGRWALRTMAADDRVRWFQSVPAKPGATRDGGYRLRAKFRDMVRFERSNLMGLVDGSLAATLSGFDLILCRNVLIYFSAEHVLCMMRGFADRLNPGGWLLIGHAEPNPAFDAWLAPVSLPGTVAYRRRDEGALPVKALPFFELSGMVSVERTPADPVAQAPSAWTAKEPDPPPPLPERMPPPAPKEPSAFAALASDDVLPRLRALADAGETGEAWRLIGEALDVHPTSAALRYYEGLLARSLGREVEAERALRGALFLDRDFVMARLHLGLLLAALGRREPATRALDIALRLAQELAPDAVLPEGDGVTASQLAASARQALDELGRSPR